MSRFQKSINIATERWPQMNKIYWLPSSLNFLNETFCKNESYCGYKSTRKENVKTHEAICSSETTVFAKERFPS